jgi:diguanylate cyclase (GGDEF)-like protein
MLSRFHGFLSMLIASYGIFAFGTGLFEFAGLSSKWEPALISLCFGMASPWSVRLPSGATWRPAIAFVLLSMFIFPTGVATLVAVPGLALYTWQRKGKWWDYPLTIGHIALGVSVGKQTFLLFPTSTTILPTMVIGMVCALAAHLIVNRLIAAFIVASKKQKGFVDQLYLTFNELNWGYFNTYIMSLLMLMQINAYGFWGFLICCIFLTGIYRSFVYYSRMRALQQSAFTDGLTGVENRRAFESFIKSETKKNETGSLIIIDLDHFKIVNDGFGHLIGDEILIQFAETLLLRLQKKDRLFRFGGDEFILFVSYDADQTVYLKVLMDLEQHWKQKGYPVGISYGQAQYPAGGTNWERLLYLADQRMYEYKNKRKHRTVDVIGYR